VRDVVGEGQFHDSELRLLAQLAQEWLAQHDGRPGHADHHLAHPPRRAGGGGGGGGGGQEQRQAQRAEGGATRGQRAAACLRTVRAFRKASDRHFSMAKKEERFDFLKPAWPADIQPFTL